MKIEIKQFNNKNRKGTYIYLKEPNKKGAYYKINTTEQLDPIIQYHKDKTQKNTQGTIKQYKNAWQQAFKNQKPKKPNKTYTYADQKVKKFRKNRKLQQNIRRGLTNVTINNTLNTTTTEIHKKTKELLRPLVYDQQILNLLATDHNMQKLKIRLEHRITLKGKNEEQLGTASIFQKTSNETIIQLKDAFKTGEAITPNTRTKGGLTIPSTSTKLKQLGYKGINIITNGELRSIKTTIIFRKAK